MLANFQVATVLLLGEIHLQFILAKLISIKEQNEKHIVRADWADWAERSLVRKAGLSAAMHARCRRNNPVQVVPNVVTAFRQIENLACSANNFNFAWLAYTCRDTVYSILYTSVQQESHTWTGKGLLSNNSLSENRSLRVQSIALKLFELLSNIRNCMSSIVANKNRRDKNLQSTTSQAGSSVTVSEALICINCLSFRNLRP